MALQIEATSEPPVWSALDGRDLAAWAGAVSRVWARFGLGRGDSIAFFDYGSNPCVLLSSSIYVPHLRRGAATRLGAEVVCNDGVASMTARLLVILEAVRPAALLVRRDLVAPLADALGTRGLPRGSRLRWAAIGEVEGAAAAPDVERLERVLGVPVRRILRADAAYLTSGDCARCGLFHLDRAYRAEALGGGAVALSARFAPACPAIRYRIGPAEVVRRGCPEEPLAARIAWG